MTIGTLHSRVVLDQPGRIHCGTDDLVTGNVVLTYQRSSINDTDLFGPLTVRVAFHGRAKTKLRIRRGKNTYTYRGRVPLFAFAVKLFDGPFRAEPGAVQSFPFTLRFPARPDPIYVAEWSEDRRFRSDQLPPTMSMHHHGFAHHFDCFNEYRIGAEAQMSNIDIRIINMNEEQEPHVLYEQPRISNQAVSSVLQPISPSHFIIQNEYLLPEADRPSGFKAKAKAIFTSDYYPKYRFDLILSAPRHAYVGERLLFNAEMRQFPESSTAVVIPDIILRDFSVKLESQTYVRAPRPILSFSEPESYATETCFVTTGLLQDPGPFSKANDFQQLIRTARLVDLPTSFATTNIMRSYRMKVKFMLTGAEKQFTVKHDYMLVVHPPIEGAEVVGGPSMGETERAQPPWRESNSQVEAGPSTRDDGSSVPLPRYEAPPPDYEKHDAVTPAESNTQEEYVGEGMSRRREPVE